MKRLILALLTLGYTYAINGTITFYDGTTLEGELSSSDIRYVIIIPEGLAMAEKIPAVDIESLNLENGISLIEDGIVQQTYIDGKFSKIERKETDEVSMANSQEEYEDYSLGNLDYFSFGVYGGVPFYYRPSLLLEDDKPPIALPNIGIHFSLPYFPIGPVNISAGSRITTSGFNKNFGTEEEPKKIKSITVAGILFTDLQPILNFMGENIHIGFESGVTYSIGWEENYEGGIGIVIGGTLDYWFEDSPLGIRLFGNGYMMPSPVDGMTGFGNVGASLILALKRGD